MMYAGYFDRRNASNRVVNLPVGSLLGRLHPPAHISIGHGREVEEFTHRCIIPDSKQLVFLY